MAIVLAALLVIAAGVTLVLRSGDGVGGASGAGPRAELASPPVAVEEVRLVRADLGEVEIAWAQLDRDGLRGFAILRDGKRVGGVAAGNSSFVDRRSKPGETYRYVVVARYAEGAEARSDPLVVRTPKPPALSEARAVGTFDVKVRISEAHGYTDLRGGQRRSGEWTLRPSCRDGACDAVATTYMFGEKARIPLHREGAVYSGSGTTSVSTCFGEDVHGTMTVELRVISAALSSADVWTASRIEGSLRFSSPTYYTGGSLYCPAAGFTGSFAGR